MTPSNRAEPRRPILRRIRVWSGPSPWGTMPSMHPEAGASALLNPTENPVNDEVTISQEQVGNAVVVRVSGELDVASAPELRIKLHELCSEKVGVLVVDLRDVTFLDSSALGVLVGALRRCRESDTQFKLLIDSPRIQKIFDITGLTSVFEITESLG